jgi:hypothetical protein
VGYAKLLIICVYTVWSQVTLNCAGIEGFEQHVSCAKVLTCMHLMCAELGEPVWWKVGAAKLQGGVTLNYAGIEGFRIAGGL